MLSDIDCVKVEALLGRKSSARYSATVGNAARTSSTLSLISGCFEIMAAMLFWYSGMK